MKGVITLLRDLQAGVAKYESASKQNKVITKYTAAK